MEIQHLACKLSIWWVLSVGEVGPLGRGDQGLDLVQVALVAGGEVVQAGHVVVLSELGFDQVGADEAGCAGDE